jgi:CHAT domain-containing protein
MKHYNLALTYLSMALLWSLCSPASALALAERAGVPQELLGAAEVGLTLLRMPISPDRPPADELPELSSDRQHERQAQIEACFARASWLLRDDGTFELRPFPHVGTVDRIAGSWSLRGDTIELHARSKSARWFEETSLDGTLQAAGGTYQLDVVAVGLNIDASLVVAVHQRLHAGEHPPSIAVESRQAPSATAPIPDPQPNADAGTPDPGRVFDIEMSGTVDGVDFAASAERLIIQLQGKAQYQVNLFPADPKAHHGWSLFRATSLLASFPPPGQRTCLSFEPKDQSLASLSNVNWFTGTARSDEDLHLAYPQTSTLCFTIGADEAVTGTFDASGICLIGGKGGETPSRIHGELHGQAEKSQLASGITDRFDRRGLTGEWRLVDAAGEDAGTLALESASGGLHGSLTPPAGDAAIPLAGTEREGAATLAATGASEIRVFLRAQANGETLIALAEGAPQGTVTWLGRRSMPPLSGPLPPAATEDDAFALSQLGVKFEADGKCGEARLPLEQALAIYRRSLGNMSGGNQAQALLLARIEAVGAALTLCDFRLEDPESLVRHLEARAETLGPRRSAALAAPAAWLRAQVELVLGDISATHQLIGQLAASARSVQEAAAKLTSTPLEPELHAALATFASELDEIDRDLTRQVFTLAELENGVDAGRLSPVDGVSRLWAVSWEMWQHVQHSMAAIAGPGAPVLKRVPQLMADRDRLWRIATQEPDTIEPVAVERMEQQFRTSIRQDPVIGKFWGSTLDLQYVSVETLHGHERLLDEAAKGLLRWPEFKPTLGADIVKAAADLQDQPDRWRQGLQSDTGKIHFQDRFQQLNARLVRLLVGAGDVDAALAVSEGGRARAFADLLAGRQLLRAERQAHPASTAAKGVPSPALSRRPTIAEIKEAVRRQGHTVIEYLMTEHELIIFVVSPAGPIKAFLVNVKRHVLEGLVGDLDACMERPPASVAAPDGPAVEPHTDSLLRQLYDYLIAPIPQELLPNGEVLTLVPFAALYGLPFAALKDPGGAYLVDRHPLVYGTSIQVMGLSQAPAPVGRRPATMLALVNPSPMPLAESGKPYPQLNELDGGFAGIAALYPAAGQHVFHGAAATKPELQKDAAAADVIYLVTHAKFTSESPLDSYVALAPSRSPADSYLRVTDVFDLDLNAGLVVLWACETGRGEWSSDGVQGLSRAFTVAGSRNLLLSLWSISQEESLAQMILFHGFWLEDGSSTASALQRAQIEYRKLRPDRPDLWAALALYGAGD